jgi:hypothetical protein
VAADGLAPPDEGPLEEGPDEPLEAAELPPEAADVPEEATDVDVVVLDVLVVVGVVAALAAAVGTVSDGAPLVSVLGEPPLPHAPIPAASAHPAIRAATVLTEREATSTANLRRRAGPSACRNAGSR